MTYHVTPNNGNGWKVKRGGASRATCIKKTQQEAIFIGRQIAKKNNSEFMVHGRNGRIRIKDSYGNDDFPPKG
jgi:hypothetical protein